MTEKPSQYSPLTMAFLGDAVYELLVREKISETGSMPVSKLHKYAVKYVCADAQAKAFEILEPTLTEEELNIFRRGRNSNNNQVPKNANPKNYRTATGLEAVFGYLKLCGKEQRIKEIFQIVWGKI